MAITAWDEDAAGIERWAGRVALLIRHGEEERPIRPGLKSEGGVACAGARRTGEGAMRGGQQHDFAGVEDQAGMASRSALRVGKAGAPVLARTRAQLWAQCGTGLPGGKQSPACGAASAGRRAGRGRGRGGGRWDTPSTSREASMGPRAANEKAAPVARRGLIFVAGEGLSGPYPRRPRWRRPFRRRVRRFRIRRRLRLRRPVPGSTCPRLAVRLLPANARRSA